MYKSSIINLAKKYKIPIILFIIAIVIRLSISYSLADWDDYQYFFGAKSILQNHVYLVDGAPSIYPMGYSLLIVPFFYFLGINTQSAGYPCAILGALTVVLLYGFVKDLVDTRAAVFASLFLIFGVMHWGLSTEIMSDVPALFFFLLGIVAAVKYANTEKAVFVYLFYFAAGFACLIRYNSALMFVIIGLYLILSNKLYLLKHKEVWIGILIFLVIVSPQLIYNHIYYGSAFTTGYSQNIGGIISLEHIFTPEAKRPQLKIISYIKCCIIGFGTPIFLFFLYGIYDWIKKRKREELSLIIPWIVVPIVILSFLYCGPRRYLIPVLPALLILSGVGFSKMCDKLGIKAEANKRKPNKTRLLDFKTIKIVLIILLVVILLVPTAMYSINSIQQREVRTECQKNTFVWIRENSGADDIIISFPEPSYEYYSQRKVYSLRTSPNELEKLISTHNNTYLVIHDVWRSHRYRQSMFDTEQWLNETYGLIHLRTFESGSQLSLTSKLFHILKNKVGISSSSATDRWDVYLIVK